MPTPPGDYELRRRELEATDAGFLAWLIDTVMAERLRSLHYSLGTVSAQAAARVWASAEHHRGRADRRLGGKAS